MTTKTKPTGRGAGAVGRTLKPRDFTLVQPISSGQDGMNYLGSFRFEVLVSTGIISAKPKGPVLQNTTSLSGRTAPSERLCHAQIPSGFGADGAIREDVRTAITSVLNICPPKALQNAEVDSKTRYRSMTMPTGTTTGKSAQNNHDHHQAALVLRATTHLSEALYQLRNSSGTTPTRKAMGLAYAAARSLSQVVGGV